MIIVSASDHNFLPGLMVLLYSAWMNNRHAHFHVIDTGLGTDGTQKLTAFCARHGIACRTLRIDLERLARLPDAGRLSASTYARLFIPELLPEHDRAIYIDADAMVLADLEPLWDFDLGDDLLAGVVDGGMEPDFLDRIGIARGHYINAGVLRMNLDRWRTERIGARCVEQLMRHPELDLADQTAINIVAKGRIRTLDETYNVFASARLPRGDGGPRILHFAGPDKPWQRQGVPMAGLFEAYGRASGAVFPVPRRAWSPTAIRKTTLGLLALRPKYWRLLLVQAERRAFVRRHVRGLSTRTAPAGRSGAA